MKITIRTIDDKKQRYKTVGDWKIKKDGSIEILVSELGNDDYNFLVGLHEMIEVWLCRKRGITQDSVDSFDINFERERIEGKHGKYDEPGDNINSPYFKEHQAATIIERLMASIIPVTWSKYNKEINNL